jgi:hypothetical protein
MEETLLGRLKRLDDQRPSFPGEHWMTLGAGVWLLTRHSGSLIGRLASIAAGAALVYRAATGRDGLGRRLLGSGLSRRAADRLGKPRSPERYIDVAAPWPYEKRVRVSAISHPVGKTIWTP